MKFLLLPLTYESLVTKNQFYLQSVLLNLVDILQLPALTKIKARYVTKILSDLRLIINFSSSKKK